MDIYTITGIDWEKNFIGKYMYIKSDKKSDNRY